jgi:uncharacterized membrane protein YecN with MAPEG domain
MILPIALTAAGAAALLHIWLSIRVSHIRRTQKILHGDGGNPAMLRRMRAHGNYAENAPIFLVLLALLELAGGRAEFLWAASIIFFLSRIVHAFGMDSDKLSKLRIVGVIGSWGVLLALGAWAISLTYTQVQPAPARQEAPALKS